jgi:hypothetical protein
MIRESLKHYKIVNSAERGKCGPSPLRIARDHGQEGC